MTIHVKMYFQLYEIYWLTVWLEAEAAGGVLEVDIGEAAEAGTE